VVACIFPVSGTWHSCSKGDGFAPQVLNGARYFSFDELQKYTDNFSQSNLIGQDIFGDQVYPILWYPLCICENFAKRLIKAHSIFLFLFQVYKGYLSNGVIIAIKRMPGVKRFKNEIELLSRVHHKNVVNLIGFCLGQGKQMLVYEYNSNGSLYDNLHGILPLLIFLLTSAVF
jgi:serine/threonine protein kinase